MRVCWAVGESRSSSSSNADDAFYKGGVADHRIVEGCREGCRGVFECGCGWLVQAILEAAEGHTQLIYGSYADGSMVRRHQYSRHNLRLLHATNNRIRF